MKVRIIRSFAGVDGSFTEGQVIDHEAAGKWIEAGFAERIDASVDEYHVGGGWYDVPGREKKVRKDEAIEALNNG